MELDLCPVLVNSSTREVCGRPASHLIILSGRFMSATVTVCEQHKKESDRSYAALRTSTKS